MTAGWLIPPLLALFELPASVVWRVASLLVAGPILVFVSLVPARRRAATGSPLPSFVRVLLAVQACVGASGVTPTKDGTDRCQSTIPPVTTPVIALRACSVSWINVGAQ